MFRNSMKSLMVLGLMVSCVFDVQAVRPQKGKPVAKDASHAVCTPQKAAKKASSKSPRSGSRRLSRPSAQRYSVKRLSAAHKAQLTKAGIDVKSLPLLVALNMSANAAVAQEASQGDAIVNFTDIFVHELAATNVGQLYDKLVEMNELADKVIAHKHWKFFEPIAPAIELVKPQIESIGNQLHAGLEAGQITREDAVQTVAIDGEGRQLELEYGSDDNGVSSDSGEVSNETEPVFISPVGSDDEREKSLEPRKPEIFIPHCPEEQLSYVRQALNACAQEKSMVISVGTIGICFIVAGTCLPMIIPAMTTGAAIGAGFGGGLSLVASAVRGDSVKVAVKKCLRNATYGALAGTIAPIAQAVVTPALVGGSLMTEAALESAVIGFITGAASGADDHKMLERAFQGAACGAAVGAVLYGLREVYNVLQQQQVDIQALHNKVQELEKTLKQVVAENAEQQVVINKLRVELQGAQEQIAQLQRDCAGRTVYVERRVEVPGPTQYVEVEVPVPGPERIIPGLTQYVERRVEVPGPTQYVEVEVPVPGPERIIPGPTQYVERRVEVPGPTQYVEVPGPEKIVERIVYVDNIKYRETIKYINNTVVEYVTVPAPVEYVYEPTQFVPLAQRISEAAGVARLANKIRSLSSYLPWS